MSHPVDLRSDTVTQPGPEMRQAMATAIVGDDVLDEDPTVAELQREAASLLGLEAALYVPSGSMANQLAILCHTRPGDDVLVGEGSHSYCFEAAAGAVLAGVQFSVVGTGGHFSADETAAAIKHTDKYDHIPPTTLVMVENTHNRGGGKVMAPEPFRAIVEVCRSRDVKLHLDGARLFNAAVASDLPVSDWATHADSVSICLSKGLGAPVGSLLAGSTTFIRRAHRFRKMLGGGMRQAGIIAAGGLYALRHHVAGLADDHRRARSLADALAALPTVALDVGTVETNICIFDVPGRTPESVCEAVADDVLVLPFGPTSVRAVTHRDVDDEDVGRAIAAFQRALG